MKNKLYQALLLIFLVAGISSCDYLDIVPDYGAQYKMWHE